VDWVGILNRFVSFLGLLGNDSSLLDLDFFNVFAKSTLDCLDDVGLISLEGEEVSSSSYFELCDLGVLLDEDSYITIKVLFLVGFLDLSAFPSFRRLRNSLGFLISLGWIPSCVPLLVVKWNEVIYLINIYSL
jgi:hypothetical protein